MRLIRGRELRRKARRGGQKARPTRRASSLYCLVLILSACAAFEAVARATTVGPWRGSRRRTSKHALSGVDDGSSSTSALSAAVSSRRGLASLPGSARSLVGEPSLRTGVCVIKVPPPPAVSDTGGIFRGYGHKTTQLRVAERRWPRAPSTAGHERYIGLRVRVTFTAPSGVHRVSILARCD